MRGVRSLLRPKGFLVLVYGRLYVGGIYRFNPFAGSRLCDVQGMERLQAGRLLSAWVFQVLL